MEDERKEYICQLQKMEQRGYPSLISISDIDKTSTRELHIELERLKEECVKKEYQFKTLEESVLVKDLNNIYLNKSPLYKASLDFAMHAACRYFFETFLSKRYKGPEVICKICNLFVKENTIIRIRSPLDKCDCVFHPECIVRWGDQKGENCPNCSEKIYPLMKEL